MTKKKSTSLITTLFIVTFSIIVSFNYNKWQKKDIIVHDVVSYYAYLPSTFIYGDVTLKNPNKKFNHYNHNFLFVETPTNQKAFKTSMGMSILYSPFFFMSHCYSILFSNNPASGFTEPYQVGILLAVLSYLLIGLLYLRKILLVFFSEKITSYTLVGISLGSNLFYYVVSDSGMSHVFSFCLISIFTYYVIIWHNKPTIKTSTIIGIVFGLIVLVRPTNILVILILILYNITSRTTFIRQMQFLLYNTPQIILIALLSLAIWIPQFLYWHTVSGDWLFFSYTGEKFFFNDPKIIEGLFSYRKGWLIYSPLMSLSIFGFLSIKKRVKPLAIGSSLLFIFLIYVTFSWWCWWYGGGFGARPLIDFYAILAIPFAISFEFILSRIPKLKEKLILIPFTFFILLSIIQTSQRTRNIIHWDGMTKTAYWKVFLDYYAKPPVKEINRPNYDDALKGIR